MPIVIERRMTMNKINKMNELLTNIAEQANINGEEYRGLFYVERNSKVYEELIKNCSTDMKRTIENNVVIEVGYNYSDHTNLSFIFTAWNKSLGFTMHPADMNAKLYSNELALMSNFMNLLNEHAEEILNLHNEILKRSK